jgi:predicted nucleotidyltransferase
VDESAVLEAILEKVSAALEAEPDVAFAYLFGSLAKGRAGPASDVDVAILLRGDGGEQERADAADRALEIEGRLERALERPTQVIALNAAPMDLTHNVLAHGLVAFSRDEPARQRFYVNHARRYYDHAHARAIFDRYRARRIREGTFGGGASDGT